MKELTGFDLVDKFLERHPGIKEQISSWRPSDQFNTFILWSDIGSKITFRYILEKDEFEILQNECEFTLSARIEP